MASTETRGTNLHVAAKPGVTAVSCNLNAWRQKDQEVQDNSQQHSKLEAHGLHKMQSQTPFQKVKGKIKELGSIAAKLSTAQAKAFSPVIYFQTNICHSYIAVGDLTKKR